MGDRSGEHRSGEEDRKGDAQPGRQTEHSSAETLPAPDETLDPAAEATLAAEAATLIPTGTMPVSEGDTVAAYDLSEPGAGATGADGEGHSTSLTPEAPHRYRFRGGRGGAELGRGGIGRVLVAMDAHLGREIAVKELLAEVETQQRSLDADGQSSGSLPPLAARFLREARITAQLEHPNIVPVYELGQRPDGTLYYTMKVVRGRTLARALKACKSLQDRLALLSHYTNLCHAIAYAHSRGVVHRDIKTENVMVGEFGETVVLDWGLAKVRGQRDLHKSDLKREIRLFQDAGAGKTMGGSALGTPAYMPPEQAEGDLEAIDERSDVWSLGAVLYEILTGRPPFVGKSAWSVIEKVRKEPVPPPRDLDDSIPPELASIAQKALQRDKENRYSSAERLAEEIQAYEAGARVGAYSYSSWELIRRFVAKNKALAFASAIVLLVLVVGSVLVYRSYRQAEREYRRADGERRVAQKAREKERRARRLAERNQRMAHLNLTRAYLSHARRMVRDRRYAGARIMAAAALLHNPHNPQSPFHFPGAGPPRTSETFDEIAAAQSVLYQASVHGMLSHEQTLGPFKNSLLCLAISRQGDLLAFGGATQPITLWSLTKRRMVAKLKVPGQYVTDLAFSLDGRRLAAGVYGQPVFVISVATHRIVARLDVGKEGTTQIRYSPDGRWLAAVGATKDVRVFDAVSGRLRLTLPCTNQYTGSLAFSPDSARLAFSSFANSSSLVSVWDLATKRRLGELRGLLGYVSGLDWSPDGSTLVTGDLRNLKIWDARRLVLQRTLQHHDAHILRAVFSRDGQRLVTTSADTRVTIWDARRWVPVSSVKAHKKEIFGAVWAPDGQSVMTASRDRTVRIYRTPSRAKAALLPTRLGMILAARYIGKKPRILGVDSTDAIQLWDTRTRRVIARSTDLSIAFNGFNVSPQGRFFFVEVEGGTDVRIFRTADLKLHARLPHPVAETRAPPGAGIHIAFSPDETLVATAPLNGSVRIWRLATRKVVTRLPGLETRPEGVGFSPDGRRLALLAGKKSSLQLWDISSPAEPRRLWRTPTRGHIRVMFSPDGRLLATWGHNQVIRLWDAEQGRLVRTLRGHQRTVPDVRFFRDGRLLASAGRDKVIRFWQISTGLELLRLPVPTPVFRFGLSPDGRHVAVPTPEGVVLYPIRTDLWRTDPQVLLENAQRAAALTLKDFTLTPR